MQSFSQPAADIKHSFGARQSACISTGMSGTHVRTLHGAPCAPLAARLHVGLTAQPSFGSLMTCSEWSSDQALLLIMSLNPLPQVVPGIRALRNRVRGQIRALVHGRPHADTGEDYACAKTGGCMRPLHSLCMLLHDDCRASIFAKGRNSQSWA